MRILLFIILLTFPSTLFGQETGDEATQTSEKQTIEDELSEGEKAGAFYQNAVQLYGEARYRESIEAFNQAILLAPESIYFCNRAIVFLEIGESEKSLRDLKSCEKSFVGEDNELAIINAQRLGMAASIDPLFVKAKIVANRILSDSLYVAPEKGWSMTSWGVLSLGVGAGLIGSAITLDFLSEDLTQSFVRESEGRATTSESKYNELRSDLETRQFIFYGLSIGGAVASALGLSLIVADLGTENEPLSLKFGVKQNGPFVKFRF